jgi:hypothetical protein
MQALAAPRLMRATARLSTSRPLTAKATPLLQKHALVSTPLVSQQRSSDPVLFHAHCPLDASVHAYDRNRWGLHGSASPPTAGAGSKDPHVHAV